MSIRVYERKSQVKISHEFLSCFRQVLQRSLLQRTFHPLVVWFFFFFYCIFLFDPEIDQKKKKITNFLTTSSLLN